LRLSSRSTLVHTAATTGDRSAWIAAQISSRAFRGRTTISRAGSTPQPAAAGG
jgi:hypothetical protein